MVFVPGKPSKSAALEKVLHSRGSSWPCPQRLDLVGRLAGDKL